MRLASVLNREVKDKGGGEEKRRDEGMSEKKITSYYTFAVHSGFIEHRNNKIASLLVSEELKVNLTETPCEMSFSMLETLHHFTS